MQSCLPFIHSELSPLYRCRVVSLLFIHSCRILDPHRVVTFYLYEFGSLFIHTELSSLYPYRVVSLFIHTEWSHPLSIQSCLAWMFTSFESSVWFSKFDQIMHCFQLVSVLGFSTCVRNTSTIFTSISRVLLLSKHNLDTLVLIAIFFWRIKDYLCFFVMEHSTLFVIKCDIKSS